MFENYIFSGIGYSLGENIITNRELEDAVKNGQLRGFSEDRIKESESYQEYIKSNSEESAFSYFAGHKMGFKSRNHVVPFPPTKAKLKTADNTLTLAVKATKNALADSGVDAEDIDAWYMSTATPTEQAPGMASILKCYFTNKNNKSICSTTTSACVGFNINLQLAIEYFKCNPNAKHIAICHSEVMSAIIKRHTDFVPYVTFADAAATIILSRVHSDIKEGVVSIVNHEDLNMIDFLGANKSGDLYMNAGIIKERATENIVNSCNEVLSASGWKKEDIDLLIPHQTGNAIVHGAAEIMKVPLSKVFQEVQKNNGNLSGASIPVSLGKLKDDNKLTAGMKILTSTAGLGGEFGAYTYIVQKSLFNKQSQNSSCIKGKTAIVTGCTGAVGSEIALELAKLGCNLLLQYNGNEQKKSDLEKILSGQNINYTFFNSDFSKPEETTSFIEFLNSSNCIFDFIIHTTGITGSVLENDYVSDKEVKYISQVNQFSPIEITKKLKNKISDTIIFIGSVAEDAQFPGSSAFVQSKSGLRAFAKVFATDAAKNKIRTIYYIPGILNSQLDKYVSDKLRYNIMLSINQRVVLNITDVAARIVQSLITTKVYGVSDSREDSLIVRRDGYII